ncbi:sensor histidine kinase inhibitor, KipI family [Algoriphagus alkaliphilus]|uniref:Sensor histidine kinase inhibitor, KipI family n=1 Tax=Algoriphagus alkaliphilus TaxID=279824 RepID=A0A1G5XU28_9BACT|nr:5-oxoprolinase subunit PxpB [Algoriphagus alkaliphilus]MBA4299114.1 allophanate hydrolase subunit 1 [Cyclobacterium sp.]SDA73999.1 sensor histidine kinase inhibitor, KipI family [Algoriphagus alkaliphilus]
MELNAHYIVISPTAGELKWDAKPDDFLLSKQLGWMEFLEKELKEHVLEARQGFTAVSIIWRTPEAQSTFQKQFQKFKIKPKTLSSQIWEIPVCYGLDYGPDLGSLAVSHRIRVNQLIELHSSTVYRLHFFGFLPGFPYLNGLPEQLHTPRKSVPDRSVEPGSVAIGGRQTGIYPQASPGGWHIIGQTPVELFDVKKSPPVWASPGDQLKFEPIDSGQMEKMLASPPYPRKR